jgi:hypothetical protein
MDNTFSKLREIYNLKGNLIDLHNEYIGKVQHIMVDIDECNMSLDEYRDIHIQVISLIENAYSISNKLLSSSIEILDDIHLQPLAPTIQYLLDRNNATIKAITSIKQYITSDKCKHCSNIKFVTLDMYIMIQHLMVDVKDEIDDIYNMTIQSMQQD